MYCKYCGERIHKSSTFHNCRKKGLLNIDKDDSFLVSAVIGAATDSTIAGALLGGDIGGALLGDALDGDIFD